MSWSCRWANRSNSMSLRWMSYTVCIIPAFRIKIDAVRGMDTYAWFMADELGEFDIQCTEYCGTGHSSMTAKLRIVPEDDYRRWLETEEE